MKAQRFILESTKLKDIHSALVKALSLAGLQPGEDYHIHQLDDADTDDPQLVDDRRFYLNEMAKLNNDLTNMQRQLAKANAELTHLAEIRNRIVGMAAHDLRNPLGIIKSFSEYLQTDLRGIVNEEQLDIIQTIHSTSIFMQRLVEGILDFSTLQNGDVVLHKSRQNLAALLEQNVKLNQTLANQHNIVIHFQAPAEQLYAILDVVKIRQVINNLLGNAVKYSPDGSKIYCSLSARDGFAHVCVRDEGVGISASDQKTIFEPFKTLSNTQNREKSVGLGLSIVKNIVEAHNGTLTLESEPGKGSTFCFNLPLA
jgi:signal transduction histidine kinase